MKGFVPTPHHVVDKMVNMLFDGKHPTRDSKVLDPGCGTGVFIEGIIRWCRKNDTAIPRVVGVDSDPKLALASRSKFSKYSSVEIRVEDFLTSERQTYDYVIGNPPYVSITRLSDEEKATYKRLYKTAQGRFDLYFLFFEQALKSLKNEGKLVFITPEKFAYVESASNLRGILSCKQICDLNMIDEQTFGNLTTYPMITIIRNRPSISNTKITHRDGKVSYVKLPFDGQSWLPAINGEYERYNGYTLADLSLRISCGVATGADDIFVIKTKDLTPEIFPFAKPTISGKQLTSAQSSLPDEDSMIIPYDLDGRLVPESDLGQFKEYLMNPEYYAKLINRTCTSRKPWYSFHETPPLRDLLRPKILCKDITSEPRFWIDKTGDFVPRHSVYYIIPKNPGQIHELCDYLNSDEVSRWLQKNCQRAANGFLRLQSNILKRIPITKPILTPTEGIMKYVTDGIIQSDTKA